MIRSALILLVLLPQSQEASYEERRSFVDTNTEKAIEAGLKKLLEWQQSDGCFASETNRATPGTTGLALYTMLALGGTLKDPAASKALDWLLDHPIDKDTRSFKTYQVSLATVALSYSVLQAGNDPRRGRAVSMLQRYADWIAKAQCPGGGWSYGDGEGTWHDHSNGQFAVLGLRAAANAGARVKREVWERELTHYKTSQQQDGGWAYTSCYQQMRDGESTSTMTAAGVMGLTMALASTGTKKPQDDRAIKKGLAAMQAQWKLGRGQYLKPLGGEPYLLYSVERACMITGQQRLGDIDWYVEGGWRILRRQGEDGDLGMGAGREPVASHCFCLLFLKRAFVPVATPSNSKPDSPAGKTEPAADQPREME